MSSKTFKYKNTLLSVLTLMPFQAVKSQHRPILRVCIHFDPTARSATAERHLAPRSDHQLRDSLTSSTPSLAFLSPSKKLGSNAPLIPASTDTTRDRWPVYSFISKGFNYPHSKHHTGALLQTEKKVNSADQDFLSS